MSEAMHDNQYNSGWTDERAALLTKLWADGLSCSQIAAELGGVTRNAVIGKVYRLGLSGRAKSPSSSSPRPRKARSSDVLRPIHPTRRAPAARVPAPSDLEIPIEQRKTLLQLTKKTCHWPIGDPGSGDFFFCGAEPHRAYPYCSRHCRVAFQPRARRSAAR
jgi:GcrA cell cycle regulator